MGRGSLPTALVAAVGLTFALALGMTQPANADGIDRTYQVGEQPGAIAIDPTDGRLYVANRGSGPGFVSVIDPTSGEVTSLATSGIPTSLALDPVHRRLYVPSFNQKFDVFDLTTMTIIATLPVYGQGVAVDTDTQRIYVAGGSDLTVIDGITNAILATRPALVGEDWFSVALDPSLHRVYVTNYFNSAPNFSSGLVVLDDRDLAITTEVPLPIQPRWGLAVDLPRHRAYVAGMGTDASNNYLPMLFAIDGVNLGQVGTAPLPGFGPLAGEPAGIAVGADRIYVTALVRGYHVLNAETLAVTQTIPTDPLRPFLAALDATGRLYVGALVDAAPDIVVAIGPGNHAPLITKAFFSPGVPTTNDALRYLVAAIDGDFPVLPTSQRDPVTLTYEWASNGVAIPGETAATLDLSRAGVGDRGDVISARVTVADPQGLATNASASVVIENAPPVPTVTLSSGSPSTADVLTATASASDADGDPVTLAYEWLRNGVVIPGATTTSLDLATHADQGDVIVVRVTATDDHGGVGIATARARVIPSSGSFLYMKSQPGDYIGAGAEWLYTAKDSTVWASLAQGGGYFTARFIQGVYAHQWSVDLAAPRGQPLVVGSYPGAIRAAVSSTTPGLQVDGENRGCNTLTGRFDVTQLSFSSSGVLMVFDATFEQHCEGAAPALVGRVRYQDDVTPGVTLPAGAIPVPTSGQFVYLNNTRGYELLFTSADSTFAPWEKLFQGGNLFHTFVVQGNYAHTVSIQIGAAPGQPIALGQYVRAVRGVPPAGTPLLDVGADGSGCSEITGKFDIEELSFAPTGELTLFQATFEQRCPNTINVLFGRVRIENPYQPGVTLPPGTMTVPTSGNFLYLRSDPTDWVGLGTEQLYTGANATFTGSLTDARDSFSASVVQGNVHRWNVNIAAPTGQQLAVRSYVRAFRAPFRPDGWPGMDIYGDGRGCNTILGKFDVNELTYWPNGELKTFQATFEQHCEGGLPALFGRVRYEALPPLQLGVTIRNEGSIPSKTISAAISGTVSCSRNVRVEIRGTVTQTQGKTIVTGALATQVDCTAPSVPWSVVVSPDTGSFKGGAVDVTATATVCEQRCTAATATGTVKLSLGKS